MMKIDEKMKIIEYLERKIIEESNESNQASIKIETKEISKKEHHDYKRENHGKSSNVS